MVVAAPPAARPLLAVDAPALLYRSYFAVPDSIKDGDGNPVNALLGMANTLLFVAGRESPRAVVLCFGQESADYRVALYPKYHAHRPPMPSALAHQFEVAVTLFREFGWQVATHESLEADDLVHSFAKVEAASGGRAAILTGDRDLFQCATDRVSVLMLGRGGAPPDPIGPREVEVRYGVRPDQVPDFIALRGDPSDGLPGAKGIGEKTARDLLRAHGSLEAVLDACLHARTLTVRSLRQQRELLLRFKEIATVRDVPVARPPDTPLDSARAAAAAERLGMRRLGQRVSE